MPLISLPNASGESPEVKKAKKFSPVQQMLYNAAAMLAQIAAGFDIRKRSSQAQSKSRYNFIEAFVLFRNQMQYSSPVIIILFLI